MAGHRQFEGPMRRRSPWLLDSKPAPWQSTQSPVQLTTPSAADPEALAHNYFHERVGRVELLRSDGPVAAQNL